MRFETFSRTQLEALTWWSDSSPYRKLDAVICDGAVRSGKTLCMGLSFVCWATRRFDGERFGICGRTISSIRRNLLTTLLPVLSDIGFACEDRVSKNQLVISYRGRSNTFFLFGGKDEASQALIQGVTLAGILMDEAALMPRSFVEQACARCSVAGSKLWFNCNPEGPNHWFYSEWIKKAEEKRALYLHFGLEDNPGLSRKVIARYRSMFSGVFYRRFILGEWVAAEGRVYDFFSEDLLQSPPEDCVKFAMSCDYGTANPFSLGLWGLKGGVWYRLREFYFDSRKAGRQMTDAEYVGELKKLAGDRRPAFIVVDPSAASFIEALRREGLPAVKADNDVASGIRLTADMLKNGDVVICSGCLDAVREFGLYCWDENSIGRDAPVKQNDHAMDEIRYFCAAVGRLAGEGGFAAVWTER
jgi:PBSX family phage terminase large subunit